MDECPFLSQDRGDWVFWRIDLSTSPPVPDPPHPHGRERPSAALGRRELFRWAPDPARAGGNPRRPGRAEAGGRAAVPQGRRSARLGSRGVQCLGRPGGSCGSLRRRTGFVIASPAFPPSASPTSAGPPSVRVSHRAEERAREPRAAGAGRSLAPRPPQRPNAPRPRGLQGSTAEEEEALSCWPVNGSGLATLTLTAQPGVWRIHPFSRPCLEPPSRVDPGPCTWGARKGWSAPQQEPPGASGRGVKLEPSGNMSEFWHKLGCCVVEKPQPKKKRRRIDRTMIGEPMNFVHLTHIGSGEMGAGDGLAMTGAVQEQMRSKGNRDRPWSNSRGL